MGWAHPERRGGAAAPERRKELMMDLDSLLDAWRPGGGTLVFLTGAGISAESGIPTFRGKDGFWTVGFSALRAAGPGDAGDVLERQPETVWCWYLARFAAASSALPNDAHRAVAALQKAYPERASPS